MCVCTQKVYNILYYSPVSQACHMCIVNQHRHVTINSPSRPHVKYFPNFHHYTQVPHCVTDLKQLLTGVHFKVKSTKQIFTYKGVFSVNTNVCWNVLCSIITCVHVSTCVHLSVPWSICTCALINQVLYCGLGSMRLKQ